MDYKHAPPTEMSGLQAPAEMEVTAGEQLKRPNVELQHDKSAVELDSRMMR
jgi:hypothetical protein